MSWIVACLSFHACASMVPPPLSFFCFLNLSLGDSSEFHCGKLKDESIGLVLSNTVLTYKDENLPCQKLLVSSGYN